MQRPSQINGLTLERYENEFHDRHLLHGVVDFWARRKPEALAFVVHESGAGVSWDEFRRETVEMAGRLLAIGYRKGDFLVTSLPFSRDHILLEYACFRIGVIHVPLDLRMRLPEVQRSLAAVKAKTYISVTPVDRSFRAECPFVERWIAVLPGSGFATLDNVSPVSELERERVERAVTAHDPAQAIFTTGSTGSPKPALLSHRSITSQNMCLGRAMGFEERTRFLVNLPPSHVGGQAEALMTTLFHGGTAVVLESFDARRSLDAIVKHGVNMIGQIPAMYSFEWRIPDFDQYQFENLEAAIYGGQQVPMPFLERLAAMAPQIATGLGLTESSGFCTYTPREKSASALAATLGFDAPIYPMSIRAPMREGGSAGEELPPGETGDVCFRGPQTFLGYVNNPEATARAVSTDGFLYTGDMGYVDDRGLHLSGRAKWVIKAAGHQVFPGDIEAHYMQFDQIAACAALGAEHRTLGEAVMLFIELKPGATVEVPELRAHARGMASYMRPLHYIFLEPGQMPLNRAAKTDYLNLTEMLAEEIRRLRDVGRWDS